METIAAISTATGTGGIGIIRMSGKECFSILSKIFITKNKINLEEVPGYTIKYGYIIDSETGEKIDEVLVSFFRAPKSYTTENMCEINSHGGTIIERKILEQCLKNGANLAEPGEFTKRAFLNGRIDLSQAESVIDLINSKTEKEAKASFNQLEGNLSKGIRSIQKKLLDIMADIEASIDYPEYDIEDVTNIKAKELLEKVKKELIELENTFQSGKLLREGVKTVIIGKPNAGKSSLLNLMLDEERAIVSDLAGTTRDTIEEFIRIKGVPLKIVDTAGIRETEDKIEEIGVKKAINQAEDAELIIAIFDNSKELEKEDEEILNLIKNKQAIILLNKTDIADKNLQEDARISILNKKMIKISTKTQNGLKELYNAIEEMYQLNEVTLDNGIIITNIRHKNQIHKAIQNIEKAIGVVDENLPVDIIAICVKQSLEDLGNITGDNVSEDIINEIFSKFCLGK